MVEASDIIRLLRSKRYRPMNAGELAQHFGIPEEEREAFQRLLRSLELQGDIVQIKQRQYAIPSKVNLMVGTLKCSPRGYGFVVPLRNGGRDIYVGEEDMGEAMHGDIVAVRLPGATTTRTPARGRRWGRRRRGFASGQIVNVVEHVNETIIGTFEKTARLCYVVPDNPCLFRDIYVADADSRGAEVGQKVIVRVTQWPSRHLAPEGEVVEVLGQDGDPAVDVLSVVYQFQLPHKFWPETEREANRIPQSIPQEEYQRRLDLRGEMTITIDPEDAKDFDDAVSIRKDPRGHWHLGVHVADVSYYVRPGSALDEDAKRRGASVYFPGQVIPMLPTPLSEGVCSLKEGEDRLAKTVLLEYSPNGALVSSQIRHSIICVDKRLTYKEADCILAGDEAVIRNHPPEITEMLSLMAELAKILLDRRLAKGALELDLPEVALRLDEDGRVKSVYKVERDLPHEIIEEFMLAANETVARFMHQNKLPYFSRVHPEPDEEELWDFAEFVNGLEGIKVNPFKKGDLQKLLDKVRGRPESYTVNLALLRSLKRAQYSGTWGPHYGLAMDHYTHFTSPIRRYPDLIAHRVLDEYLSDGRRASEIWSRWEENLVTWAEHCSMTERRAEDAEREITKLKLLRHLDERRGEVMEGVITGVEEFGLFVQLKEFLLDGLIHIRNLADDFYKLDRKRLALVGRSGRLYRIGDEIRVKIERIDFLKREIDFIKVD